jgi:serine/threonine protein kinase
VLPAGLEKVKSQELCEFITQCIAHDPDSRPDTRQLLKHPFFESIRTGKVLVERSSTLADRPSEEVQVRQQQGSLALSGCYLRWHVVLRTQKFALSEAFPCTVSHF